ncbi:MAG TPA: DUF4294 domain-containing protein [Edaphocola sp.]|nr:DUF4294 domain-containing protein [Edaphocola sp.]
MLILILWLGLGVWQPQQGNAQTTPDSAHHKIMTGGIVVGRDTFPFSYLPMVFIEDRLSPQQRAYWDNLRYNVAKVYPYAVTAAYVLKKVDEELDIRTKKKTRKAYIKATQKALNDRFKDELKNLTITQGKILVKLINRETGRDCYDVIKELRGGLNARIFQTMAFLFDNNLKEQYDPYGKDRDIETIVQEIEAKNYYRYQSNIMEQRAGMTK